MLRFRDYIQYVYESAKNQLNSKIIFEATLTASGIRAEYDRKKYIDPFVGEKDTHSIKGLIPNIDNSRPVSVHGHEIINGKHHAIISQDGGPKQKVPFSKLIKPTTKSENLGHGYENDFVNRLKHHGLMNQEDTGAGSTAGTDFKLINKAKKTVHSGVVTDQPNQLSGETKLGHTAAFGQITIHHTPERGWHITDRARANRPEYARAIEEAGVIKHMNENYGDLSSVVRTASGRAKNVVIKHPNMNPAESYLKDHHVDVLQVGGGKGTYRVGDKDATSHGLPRMSGKGQFIVREKRLTTAGNVRTVQFSPDGKHGLESSSINLDHDEHIENIKKTLGHA
jgi:hypothetical protein